MIRPIIAKLLNLPMYRVPEHELPESADRSPSLCSMKISHSCLCDTFQDPIPRILLHSLSKRINAVLIIFTTPNSTADPLNLYPPTPLFSHQKA